MTEDIVQLEFLRPDGILITQFLDFQNQVQIYRLMILAEEEQLTVMPSVPYQTVCFVMKLGKEDFIAADAIAKLRQKNPHTIRIPEEDAGRTNSTFDYVIDQNKSGIISGLIGATCRVGASVYAQESDLKFWAALHTSPEEALRVLDAVKHAPVNNKKSCWQTDANASASTSGCACHMRFCIAWYPCGLKFCRGHDSSGKALSYRCGIKTYQRCLHFNYPVDQREYCPWDE